MAASQSSVVMTITELRRTGAGEIVDSTTSFRWDGLTHSSAQNTLEMSLEGTLVRKKIPGSNEIVHQAMSMTWEPFELKGEWRDIWMGEGQAWQTYLDFGRMAQRMPLVRVTVGQLSFVGIIQRFVPTYHHEGWIEWSFTLSPEENENVKSEVTLDTPASVQSQPIPQWVKDATDAHSDLTDTLTAAMDLPVASDDVTDTQTAVAEIDDSVSRINDLTKSVGLEGFAGDLVSSIKSVGQDVTELVWALPTEFERLQRAAINVATAVRDQRADLTLAYDDLLQSLRFTQYVHDTTAGCWNIVQISRDAAEDLRSRSSDKPRAIYVAKPGDTFERISFRYYRTPNNADLIMNANHLSSIVLRGGEELIIPDVGA